MQCSNKNKGQIATTAKQLDVVFLRVHQIAGADFIHQRFLSARCSGLITESVGDGLGKLRLPLHCLRGVI